MGARIAKARAVARTPQAYVKNVDSYLEGKPSAAPRHPSTVKAYENLAKSNPEFKTAAQEKNENLHSMLESVRVESTGPPPDEVLLSSGKTAKVSLPNQRRLTIEQVRELFLQRKLDPNEWTDEKISEHYKLEPEVVKNLLTYYSSFYIVKPPKVKEVES